MKPHQYRLSHHVNLRRKEINPLLRTEGADPQNIKRPIGVEAISRGADTVAGPLALPWARSCSR